MSRLLSAALAVALFGGCATTATSGKPATAETGAHIGASAYASTYVPIASAPTLITNATVLIGDGQRLEGADVLLQDGRIAAVGTGLQAPANAQRVDGTGKWVTPGIIDVHSHLGVYRARAPARTATATKPLRRTPRRSGPSIRCGRRIRASVRRWPAA